MWGHGEKGGKNQAQDSDWSRGCWWCLHWEGEHREGSWPGGRKVGITLKAVAGSLSGAGKGLQVQFWRSRVLPDWRHRVGSQKQ